MQADQIEALCKVAARRAKAALDELRVLRRTQLEQRGLSASVGIEERPTHELIVKVWDGLERA